MFEKIIGHSRTSSNPYQSHSSVRSPYTTSDMSRYSPRRQDSSSRAYHEPTTATSRQYPLSSRSFGTADNSPGKTYKRNTPLTERGSPVSRASSFSAGRSSSTSRKNDTAETSGESPTKTPKISCIPQVTNTNRDGTSSLHSRLSSRAHQDTASGKTDSSSTGEHKQNRIASDSNLPSPRRRVTEDMAAQRDSSQIGQRSLGRGQSESPSRSSQDSDGGSPSNIPLRTSYRRGLEGEKNSDPGTGRMLRSSGRAKSSSGRVGISASESADSVSTKTSRESKQSAQKVLSSDTGATTPTNAPSLPQNKNEKPSKEKISPDGFKGPSPDRNLNLDVERSKLTMNLKTGNKTEGGSKAMSPPRTTDTTPTKQQFDRGDIKYNSCKSRIPTLNSPSGSRKGSESPVRQKLSSHSFSASRTTESDNANNDEAGSSKIITESRADRIARYKDLRRRELASKIKSKLDPETNSEPEAEASTKNVSEEKSKNVKQADFVTESTTAAKASATRSATADSSKIICGMKVSKNIAERAKKRQERMLRNSQHLSAELIGRRAKISALCNKEETPEGTNSEKAEAIDKVDFSSLKPDMDFNFGQSKNQLQPYPLQDMESLSPSSLSLSDYDKDPTYQQLTPESSDISPDDKRLSLTELESLPEINSSDESGLNTDQEMVTSDKRVSLSELSPLSEDVLNQNEPVKDILSPPEETTFKLKPRSLCSSETISQESKPALGDNRSLNISVDKDTQHKFPVTSPRNRSSSLDETAEKAKFPPGKSTPDPGITSAASVPPDSGKKDDPRSKSLFKIPETKDVSFSSASFRTKPPSGTSASVAPENQVEQVFTSSEKVRARPPPSTVLYTKKLLESGNVKKDQKRVDYDLQKELDWLEHRRYQYADETSEEKKLSVLEMVRAREGKGDDDEEKPRKPVGRTMSEARGKDAAQTRREILASRISSLGRTRSFGMAPAQKPDASTGLGQEKTVLSPIKDSNLDELLMKNVAYLDDENLPTEPSVRSLHPEENLKLRKSLRKKKAAKLSSLLKGTTEDNRISLNRDENAVEIPTSKATLKLKESAPAASTQAPVTPKQLPVSQPVTQNIVSPVASKQLNVTQRPARPNLAQPPVKKPVSPTVAQGQVPDTTKQQLHVKKSPVKKAVSPTVTQGQDTTKQQLHVTQPPVKKPVSPTVAQGQVPDTTKQQLHVTQPPVKKPVAQGQVPDTTKQQLHVKQPPVRKPVSPTAAQPPVRKPVSPTVAQGQVPDTTQQQLRVTQSSVTKPVSPTSAATKELPTSAVPAQADVRDSPHRKRVRSRSRGRPVSENVADPAQVTSQPKKRREKSGTRKAKLGALEEDLDTKGRSPDQELPPTGLTATEKATALLTFENNNASTRSHPPAAEGATQSRRSRMRVNPNSIPEPILDVIKASLDYEQNGTQSKAEPSRIAQVKQSKPSTLVSAGKKKVLVEPRAPVQPSPENKSPQEYGPVVGLQLSDASKSGTATVNQLRMNEDTGAPVHDLSLDTKVVSSGSITIAPSPEVRCNIRKKSLENIASSKIPFHTTDANSEDNAAKNLVAIKESSQDDSKVPAKDFTDVELFIREDSDLEKKDLEESTKPPESNCLSTSRLSLTPKATEPVSSQVRKSTSSLTQPDDGQPQKKEVGKTEISSAQSTISPTTVTSTAVPATVAKVATTATVAKTVISEPEVRKSSVTSIPTVTTNATVVSNVKRPSVTSVSVTSNGAIPTTPTETTKTNVTQEVKRPSVTSAPVTTAGITSTTPAVTTKTNVTQEAKRPSVPSVTQAPVTTATVVTTTPAVTKTNVTQEVKRPSVPTVTSAPVTTTGAITTTAAVTTKPNVTQEAKRPSVPSVTQAPVTTATVVTTTPVVTKTNVTQEVKKPPVPTVTSAQVTTAAVTTPTSAVTTKTNVTQPVKKPAVPSVTQAPVTTATVVTTTPAVTTKSNVTQEVKKAPVPTVTSAQVTTAAVKTPTPAVTTKTNVTQQVKKPSVTSAPVTTTAAVTTTPAVTTKTNVTQEAKRPSIPSVTSAQVTTAVTTNVTQEAKRPSVTSAPVTTATVVTTTPAVTTKANVTQEVKRPSVTTTSATIPASKTVVTSVTSKTPEVKPAATVTAAYVTSSVPVTTVTSPSATSAPQTSVTNVTSSQSLTPEAKKPAVISSTPVTTTTSVASKAPSVTPAAPVTVSAPVTTTPKSSTGTETKLPTSVTSSASVAKTEPVTSATSSVTQISSVTSTNMVMAQRAMSLSPTLTESYDLTRSLELTQKDIENGNLMTRSEHFSHARMSEGSLNIPRRGILKRSGSLRANSINSELIDPELASVFQARRIKEVSEQPTSDLAEEDSVFDDRPQYQDSLLSEVIDEESEMTLSVAERISHLETRISVSTSGCTTPKSPRSRLGSVPRMAPENENRKSILPQEELFNKLTDLARSKEATQERQKRYHRSRDDWRTRTQPVTLKEVEQADSLESVSSFRALVMKRSSINIFEQILEQDKRRRLPGHKTEYPQPYTPEKRNRSKNRERHKTLPVTAAELMAIPEGEAISLEVLKSKMQALRESKTDSGIVSSGSDIEKDSHGSDSVRSLTTDADNEDDDFSHMSVAARASLFRQMEEKSKKSASGAKRYIDRKKRERSRTQPITEEEVKTAAELADEEANKRKMSLTNGNEEPQQFVTEKPLDVIDEPQATEEEAEQEAKHVLTLEKLIESDQRDEEADVAKHSDELARQTLADKVKLFSSEKEAASDKPNRTDAPVIRRRNRRFASRFNTQPITTEEMENVFRISPLAISLVKPPDPDILKGLPLNAQRELTAQYAEACLSQQGSRAGSRAGSRPGSQSGSRRGSIEESEESKAETKGILKMADYQKDLQQVKSILKTESGRDSPEREIKSILKSDAERKDSEPGRSILKLDSNEQAKLESETRSILKSSEPEPRRSSKQLDSEPRGILNVHPATPKASEPRSALKKDSSWDKNGSEPRGILKKESSFDLKKEPERGILKKDSSIENLSSEDSDISDLLVKAEEVTSTTPVATEGKKKEYRRGSDERYLTQPVTEVEKKSPESPRKQQRYAGRHHKTQPVTPEEKKEATQVIQPVIKMSGSLAERLQALQKSGEEDWKKRLSKTSNSPSPSPDRELRLSSPETTPLRPANLSERMSLLRSSQTSWRSRVEESDAKAFTVEGKLSKSGQTIRERSVVTKLKQTVKTTEIDQSSGATSPSTPTKGDFRIPIPKEIIASETTLEETIEKANNIVKLPELKDDGLDQFFGSSPNLFDKNELLDISVDDFNEIFQTSQNVLIHSVKARPKKKVQARSKNPLKSRSANLERQEYEEYKTNVAEMELKRIKKEALSKDAGFAEAALAGLASKENFSKIELRKTDPSVPSPGGNRYLPYKPLMLLHVKGRRHVQTRLVEPSARNVNQGDCYVLVTSDKVINWIGEYSNIIEKAKSADIAAHIQQKKDMGYKSSSGIITIDSKKTSSELFWSLLDGHESECQECGGVDEDEIYENAMINTNMIYQIEKNMLVPFEEYWGGLPRYEILKSNQVYIFDFGAEIYMWQGKKASPQRRKLGLELMQQLWDKGYNYEMSTINPLSPLQGGIEDGMKNASGQRPPWALIAKVNENMETVLFREKFADWPDSARLIKVKTVDSNSNKTENGDLIPYDALKLIDKDPPEALLMTLDGSQVGRGTFWREDMGGFIQEFEIHTLAVTMWHILEFDHYKLESLSNGQFHEGDTYVVRWEYRIIATGAKSASRRSAVGRERCAYFFWQGQTSTITEKGASALMTVELDEERGPQVRVLQGKEPPCFLNLFQGQMVVHIGKREEEDTNTQGSWRFYSVRHEQNNEMCLIEIDAHISSLRSRSSFILFNVQNGKVFIWHGDKSLQSTRSLALNAVNSIQARHPLEMGLPENINVSIAEMNEGSEKPEFWMALRSRDRSQYISLLNDPRSYNFSLRLFHFTSVSGVIDVTEIRNPTILSDKIAPYPFLQSDLYKVSQPALFLLDNGYEVYLWQGWWPEGDEEIENVLTGSAQARLMVERRCAMQTAVDYCQAKNLSDPIKPYLVYGGLEPLKFINIFPFWSIDETVKELSLKDGKCDGDLVSAEDELNRLSLIRYTFKELLERPLPEDVDPLKLESYLSDDEFEDALKMTRTEYYSLPSWKQSKLKQDLGLF